MLKVKHDWTGVILVSNVIVCCKATLLSWVGGGICETFLTVTTIVALVGFSNDGLKIIT